MIASTTIEAPPTHRPAGPVLLLAAVIVVLAVVALGLQWASTDTSTTKGVVTPSTSTSSEMDKMGQVRMPAGFIGPLTRYQVRSDFIGPLLPGRAAAGPVTAG